MPPITEMGLSPSVLAPQIQPADKASQRQAIAWLTKSVPASEHDDHEVQLAAYCVTEAAESKARWHSRALEC
jgi:hypothetical protein